MSFGAIKPSSEKVETRSVDAGGCLQINLLPIAFDNSRADLPRRLALLVHCVAVVKLLQTSAALRAVSAREAAVQAVVSHAAIAVAIAGLLMDHLRNLRRQLISMSLIWELGVLSPKLVLVQDRLQFVAFGGGGIAMPHPLANPR